ncbi:MAG: signal transduction histidine kinase [Marivirga sp.]|jgi:signal transduction histidine kinase
MWGIDPAYDLVDLGKLLSKAEKYHELRLKQQDLHLIIDLDQNTFFYTDEEIVSIALNNILSNAIKFSPKETTIRIMVKIIDKTLILKITDQE